jgi:putative oxidoreductase
MRIHKTIYWVSTILFAIWMLKNAYLYLFVGEAKILCVHFGLPDYLRIELAIAKILGTIVLLLPVLKGSIKEWAYAGFAITMVSGFIAHLCSGDSVLSSLSAIVALVILLISYFYYHKLYKSN